MLTQLVRMQILKVARKDNHIGLQGIDTIYGTLQQPLTGTGHRTHMGIAELHDAITVEGLRQVGRNIVITMHFQLLVADKMSVEHQSPDDQSAGNSPFAPMASWHEPATKEHQQQRDDDESHDQEEGNGIACYHNCE